MPGDLAALGPFFAVGTHPPGGAPAAPWRPAAELTAPSPALRERIASVRAALAARGGVAVAEIEPRVAASAAHLGLAARLTAPALGAAVLRCPLDLRQDELWWQDGLGGPVPLSVPLPAVRGAAPDQDARLPADGSPGPAGAPAVRSLPLDQDASLPADGSPGPAGAPARTPRFLARPGEESVSPQLPAPLGALPGEAISLPVNRPAHAPDAARRPPRSLGRPGPLGEWDQVLVDELLAPLTAAVAELVPVSGRVLRGNVASAANAAAAQVARQRPDLAARAWQAAARLLGHPWLHQERNPPGPAFRRSSCCLFYRLAPGNPSAVCGDCVLAG